MAVLPGLLRYDGKRMLSWIMNEVGEYSSLSGESRLFLQTTWSRNALELI